MKRAAVFTLGRDEVFHLPQWITYYSRHFDSSDMYVLDHQSTEPAVVAALDDFAGNVVTVKNDVVFNHDWLLETVHGKQRELLERYEYVLYTDTDEIVIPATGTLREFIERADQPAYRCTGYEIVGDQMHRSGMYDKTLMSSHPLTWDYGYHTAQPGIDPSGELVLYHLHRMDFDQAWAKNLRWAAQSWDAEAVARGHSIQNQITDADRFSEWFYRTNGQQLQPLTPQITEVLSDFAKECGK